jgi:hypothetical protein
MYTEGDDSGRPVIRCPVCSTRVGRVLPARCPSCAAPIDGPTGQRLLAVDERIAALTAERRELLTRLRQETVDPAIRPVAADEPRTATPPADDRSQADRDAGAVVGDRLGAVGTRLAAAGPQTLLAVGGVLLLAVAAIVFTAVSWRDLPMVARGGVLLGAAVASGRLTATLAHRELERTAEATGVLTIALLAVLCNGLWRAGLLDLLGRDLAVLTVVSALLAVGSHLLAPAWPCT